VNEAYGAVAMRHSVSGEQFAVVVRAMGSTVEYEPMTKRQIGTIG
jgi:hypothetical protein